MADSKTLPTATSIVEAQGTDPSQFSGQGKDGPKESSAVARMENISQNLTLAYRVAIFTSIFLVGFSYGLASSLVAVYQSYATAGYQTHSLLATSNTLRSVFSVAAQPAAAKLTDVIGRLEIAYLCATFYVVGLIVQASSTNVATFVAGAVLNQVGLATTQVMLEVVIAGITSTRARLFGYNVPNLHFIFTIWISGNISSAMLKSSTSNWRWGIGMWAIIYSACLIPFVISMKLAERHAHKNGAPKIRPNYKVLLRNMFWQIDAPGLALLLGALALILTPVSLAGAKSTRWSSAGIIAPLVIGILCIPAFAIWELRAPHPLVPFKHIRDRSVWGALGIAVFWNFAAGLQRGYLYTVLVVAFDFSIMAATRISTIYGFTAFVIAPLTGLVVYRVRRLKPFIMAGTIIYTVGFGLLVRFRGSSNSTPEQVGIIAGQVLIGFGGGLFGNAASVGMQARLKHEHIAVMIALYMATAIVGNALGSSVSGAVWNQVLPTALETNLGNSTLAMSVFANPFPAAAQNPIGTPLRTAIVESYQHVQKILCATGLGLCIPLICFAFAVRNDVLTDEQTLAENEHSSSSSPELGADEHTKQRNSG